MKKSHIVLALLMILSSLFIEKMQGQKSMNEVLNVLDYITSSDESGVFPVFAGGKATTLYVADSDEAGVKRVAKLLQKDFYMVDPGLVLQKIVIDTGGLKPSYLGPQESPFVYH